MARLVREKRTRYFDTEPQRSHPLSRRHGPLACSFNPLQLLIIVAIGAGIAHFVPNLLNVLLNFGTILAVGLVGYFVWQHLRR